MLEKCADCRFFRYTQGLDNIGQCHRKPPKVVLLGNLLTRKFSTNLFVSVTDDSFCGEFQPRTEFVDVEMQTGFLMDSISPDKNVNGDTCYRR